MDTIAIFGTSRHPFRASLPMRVLRRLPQFEPEVLAKMAEAEARAEAALMEASRAVKRKWLGIGAQDVRDFLLSYCAFLMAALAFLG